MIEKMGIVEFIFQSSQRKIVESFNQVCIKNCERNAVIYLFMRCRPGNNIIKNYNFLFLLLETWTSLVDGVDWASAGRGCSGVFTRMLVGGS